MMNDKQIEMDYIIQSCACAHIRKSARTVTQAYEKKMSQAGLKVTQYYMLVNIARHQKLSISELGEMLLLEQSTVTRNVTILKKEGYVSIAQDSNDARIKSVSITDQGLQKIEEATPYWLQIQDKFEKKIGKEQYQELLKLLTALSEAVE